MSNEEFELLLLRNVEQIDSQRSLAQRVGYSVGKVNYILNALMEKGLVKTESFLNTQNKRKYSYLLTEKGIKEKIALTKKFVERKKAEYETLQRELEMYEMSVQTQGEN